MHSNSFLPPLLLLLLLKEERGEGELQNKHNATLFVSSSSSPSCKKSSSNNEKLTFPLARSLPLPFKCCPLVTVSHLLLFPLPLIAQQATHMANWRAGKLQFSGKSGPNLMLMSPLSSSSSSGHGSNATTRPKNEGAESGGEPVTIGDGSAPERPRNGRSDRPPLAPVQSSQKRKRDRPSLDGYDDEVGIRLKIRLRIRFKCSIRPVI